MLFVSLGLGRWDEMLGNVSGDLETIAMAAFLVFILAVMFNLIPDYLSLLATRHAIVWMARRGSLLQVLVLDAVATVAISVGWMWLVIVVLGRQSFGWAQVMELLTARPYGSGSHTATSGSVLFYSAFFTSAWLWLYATSVLLSRVLIRMNAGVGVLLGVTDLEKQPLRSLGFVCVLVVSGLFLVGLPFVLY